MLYVVRAAQNSKIAFSSAFQVAPQQCFFNGRTQKIRKDCCNLVVGCCDAVEKCFIDFEKLYSLHGAINDRPFKENLIHMATKGKKISGILGQNRHPFLVSIVANGDILFVNFPEMEQIPLMCSLFLFEVVFLVKDSFRLNARLKKTIPTEIFVKI